MRRHLRGSGKQHDNSGQSAQRDILPCSLHRYPLFLPVQIRRTGEVDFFRALAACQGQGGDFQSEAAKIRPDLDADNPHIIRAGKGHRLTFALITLMENYSNTKPRERRFSLGVCTRTQRLIQSQDKDFKGHSLSVSDVVVLHQDGQDAAHFVDSVGFREVPEFLQEQKQLTPDDLETGETVKTPRGTFHVTAMSREQIEAAGYGFHHQSDDGKYLIMGNGTRAFAVAAEQAQRDNPLKTAEQTTEQNGNMIDGIINNTPTVDELEAKVKAGEQISLVDLANAVKADKERGKGAKPEKKPSIRAQLRADKEKAQKKNAKQKSQDLERS